ncbi:hypothetical protein [Bradyrhizobium genosp. P]|uniref:hypothetical protein n=1 Tax=Bradyrhizobium genosp. P TaxID=83641 RepID=UPI003CF0B686
MTARCICSEDTGWVCENHQDQSWTGPHACGGAGAGASQLQHRGLNTKVAKFGKTISRPYLAVPDLERSLETAIQQSLLLMSNGARSRRLGLVDQAIFIFDQKAMHRDSDSPRIDGVFVGGAIVAPVCKVLLGAGGEP